MTETQLASRITASDYDHISHALDRLALLERSGAYALLPCPQPEDFADTEVGSSTHVARHAAFVGPTATLPQVECPQTEPVAERAEDDAGQEALDRLTFEAHRHLASSGERDRSGLLRIVDAVLRITEPDHRIRDLVWASMHRASLMADADAQQAEGDEVPLPMLERVLAGLRRL